MRELRNASSLSQSGFQNPAAKANWLSIATFWYTIKIFKLGLKREFDEDDLSEPLKAHRSAMLGDKLAREWVKEVEKAKKAKRKPGLFIPLAICFGLEIFIYGILLGLMELGVRIFQPLFIGLILKYMSVENDRKGRENSDGPRYLHRLIYYWDPNQSRIEMDEALLYAFGTVFCSFVAVVVIHPVFTALNYCGMKIRIAVCSLIYRKVLRLDSTLLNGQTIGNVINILSNDVNKFEQLHFFHYLWLGPATILGALYFLYHEIGISGVYGMCPVMFCIPLQIFLGALTRVVRSETAVRTDHRVQIMNEIIQGIRVLKMYAWEYAFSASLHKTRKHEMHSLIKASVIKGVMMSLILFITRSGHFFSCFFYMTRTGHITIENVFFIVSFFQILRMTMTVYYPQGFGHICEIFVATKRIKAFMALKEADISNPEPMDPMWRDKLLKNPAYNRYFTKRHSTVLAPKVQVRGASLKYGKSDVLKNVNITMEPGTLSAVIGPVGAGKSCFLYMLLGELKPFKGTITVDGLISYASQDPFLFAGSIRQNILFGSIYDRKRYHTVIKACALSRDFTLLPYGDRTLVGEKGISLSGGQRARINLARAVYRDAEIYLLDDPLSAVDTNVGRHIYEECITGLLSTKIVILTTHQWQYLKNIEQILFLEDGNVKALGNYQDVFYATDFFSRLDEEEHVTADDFEKNAYTVKSAKSVKSVVSQTSPFHSKKPNQKEFQEMRGTGVIGCGVLKNYYLSGGNWLFVLLLLFLFLLAQVAASVFDYLIASWAKVEDLRYFGEANHEVPDFYNNLERSDRVKYTGIAIASTMGIALTRSFYFYGFCMRASIGLHNRMFKSVTRSNLRFFTLNASGRILNRFSKDMGAVDEILPYAMVDTYQILLNFVGVIGLLVFINIWLLLITLVVCVIFYIIRKYYLRASCSLKRLEGVARSPVFTHVNATMQGLAVIRSHANEGLLVEEFDKFQDIHTTASFLFMAASRAFGYLLDMMTVVYTSMVIYYFLCFETDGSADVALILTQCIGLTGIFQWGMRQSAEFETQLTSVERVLEFTTLEPEPPLESEPGKAPPPNWPTHGEIELKNVFLKYSLSEQPVLRNVSLRIKAQDKIGIVGRTGAGKSSIIQCLFRLAYIEGQILIDNLDTATIGLHALRKKISIIPQEPVIFSGTLRYNLDPFQEYNDVILYSALVDVDLKLAENIDCLNEYMTDGGANLSVGSRQLVCLARAIVRNNKILIMDEATANVDLQTDNFIQTLIREKFSHCTVLTIAHRLNTIMDSDKVLVMEAGQVMEYDHPYLLMQDPQSMFSELISKTGPANVERFMAIASETYTRKRSQ